MLLRGDYNGRFSGPIKKALAKRAISSADPEAIRRLLGDIANRRLLEMYRLVDNRTDSLAWASLLHLADGVGSRFLDFIYARAKASGQQFGEALLTAHAEHYPDGPTSSARRAETMVDSILRWLSDHQIPSERSDIGWGAWIIENSGGDVVPAPSVELAELLVELDGLAEPN